MQEIYQTVALEKRISLLKLCIPALKQTRPNASANLAYSFVLIRLVFFCFVFFFKSTRTSASTHEST